MTKLGFTFYPKDWWTSDSFFALNPFERYIYLELLFMMYDNSGYIQDDRIKVERRLLTTIKEDVWLRITDLMVKDGDQLTHKSVNKRLRQTLANRENGNLGGRPRKNTEKIGEEKEEETENSDEIIEKIDDEKTVEKPKKPILETQNENPKNPSYKKKENINKKENNIIDFSSLLSFINSKTGRSFKKINDSVKNKFNARLKEGYSKNDILSAIKNSVQNDYHISNNFQYLTPEFFSRAETLDKYSEIKVSVKNQEQKVVFGPHSV